MIARESRFGGREEHRATVLLGVGVFAVSALVHASLFGGLARPLAACVLGVVGLVALGVSLRLGFPRDAGAFGVLAVMTATVTFARIAPRFEPFGDNVRYLAMTTQGLSAVSEEPFASRWLTPLLAGALNVTPCEGAHALSCLGFSALAVAFFGTAVLAARLAKTSSAGLFALVVLSISYLAEYAGWNRLLTDPLSYALDALLVLAFVESDAVLYALALFFLALNTEKVLVFLPLALLVTRGAEGTFASRVRVGLAIVAPSLIPIAIRFVQWHGKSPAEYYGARAALLAAWPPSAVWFPFFACTVPAFLSVLLHRSRASALALLGVAAFVQVAFADDTGRMTAYAFVFLVPFAARFVADAAAALGRPRAIGVAVALVLCLLHRAFDGTVARLLAIGIPLGVAMIPAVRRSHFAPSSP